MSASLAETLSRARDYPYDFPRRSFTYQDRDVIPFDPAQTDGRVPVLAIGSNQSPHRLTQKYGHLDEQVIPVQRVRLVDFDIFYCAHVTNYGAIGAMLQHCPGAEVELALNWLDEEQLELMHKTEGNYDFSQLEGIELHETDGTEQQIDHPVHVYVGQAGHLIMEGEPVAMSAISCRNRQHPSHTTGELLTRIHQWLHPDQHEEDFIANLVRDRGFRLSVTARLSEGAIPFRFPYQVIGAA